MAIPKGDSRKEPTVRRDRRARRSPDREFDLTSEDFADIAQIDPNSATLSQDLADLYAKLRARNEAMKARKEEAEFLRRKIIELEQFVDAMEPDDDDQTPIRCGRCGEFKPANRFRISPAYRHDRAPACRGCEEQASKKQIDQLRSRLSDLMSG